MKLYIRTKDERIYEVHTLEAMETLNQIVIRCAGDLVQISVDNIDSIFIDK